MSGSNDDVWRPSGDLNGVAKLTTNEPIYRPEILQTISEAIDDLDEKLRGLSVEIHGMSVLAVKDLGQFTYACTAIP